MYRKILTALILLLAAYLAWLALLSLQWPLTPEGGRTLYYGYLSGERGYLPYRDFVTTALPGRLLLGRLAAALPTTGETAVRLLTLFALTVAAPLAYRWLRPWGERTAVLGTLLTAVGGLHLSVADGAAPELWVTSLLLGALLLLRRGAADDRSQLGAGLLMGVAGLVMPVLLPATVAGALYGHRMRRRVGSGRHFLFYFGGVFAPGALALLTVFEDGGGSGLLKSVELLGLLGRLEGRTILTGVGWLEYVVVNWQRLGGQALWLLPAALGVLVTVGEPRPRRLPESGVLVVLGGFLTLAPVVAGTFEPLRWWPALFFWLLLAATALAVPAAWQGGRRWAPLLALLMVMGWRLWPPSAFIYQVSGYWERFPPQDTTVEIGDLLAAHVPAGETVQPIYQGYLGLGGMWRAEAVLATPFGETDLLFASDAHAGVLDYRRAFLKALTGSPPAWLLLDPSARVALDPAFTALVLEDFLRVADSGGHQLYRRRTAP